MKEADLYKLIKARLKQQKEIIPFKDFKLPEGKPVSTRTRVTAKKIIYTDILRQPSSVPF